jgi:hypothetical protein
MVADELWSDIGYGISTRMTDNQYPILVIDSRHPTSVSAGSPRARGRADVWFESSSGARLSRVFTREEFLALADTIPPHRFGWDVPPHDCGYDRFFADAPAAVPSPGL